MSWLGSAPSWVKPLIWKFERVWNPLCPSFRSPCCKRWWKFMVQPSSFGEPQIWQVNHPSNVQANRHNCVSNKLMENSFYFKLHKSHNYKYVRLKWTYIAMAYKQMNKLSPVTFYLSSSWILKGNMMVAAFMGRKISLWCIKVYMIASSALMWECIKQMLT